MDGPVICRQLARLVVARISDVPEVDRAVVARRGKGPLVRREGDGIDRFGQAEDARIAALNHVPEVDREMGAGIRTGTIARTARSKPSAFGREGDPVYPGGVHVMSVAGGIGGE